MGMVVGPHARLESRKGACRSSEEHSSAPAEVLPALRAYQRAWGSPGGVRAAPGVYMRRSARLFMLWKRSVRIPVLGLPHPGRCLSTCLRRVLARLPCAPLIAPLPFFQL